VEALSVTVYVHSARFWCCLEFSVHTLHINLLCPYTCRCVHLKNGPDKENCDCEESQQKAAAARVMIPVSTDRHICLRCVALCPVYTRIEIGRLAGCI
jgi:hypothetical protein